MNRYQSKLNIIMINKTHTLFAVAAMAFVGSAHAVTYSVEDFEGGIVNYDIAANVDGGALVFRQDGEANITADMALAGTDYINQSPSRSGIWAQNNLPLSVTNEPSGQHGFVGKTNNRSLTLNDPLTLLNDNVGSLNIKFDTMVYGNGEAFSHTGTIFYSALGDFTDQVMIASYSTSDWVDPSIASTALPSSVLGNFDVVEDEWKTLDLSISSTDVTFTNTAKVRFLKWAPDREEQMVFYDNIEVSGTESVPEPSSVVLFGLGGLALLRRRRK